MPRKGEAGSVPQDLRHDDGAARRRDDQSEIPRAEADHQVKGKFKLCAVRQVISLGLVNIL